MLSALSNVKSLQTETILSVWLILPAIAIFYYWKWSRSRTVRLLNAIPGPKALPVLGNLLDLNVYNEDFYKDMGIDWVKMYGPIYRIWLGPRPIVILASAELVQKLLSSSKYCTQSSDYSHLSSWLGNSMFMTTGTHWKNRRRIVRPGFHTQNFDSFIDIFNEKSSMCAEEFERIVEAKPDTAIDVTHLMTKCALNIICETAMGQTKQETEKEVYLNNMERFCQIFTERVHRPWLSNDWIYKMSSLRRECDRCVNALHAFTNKVARDRREMLERCTNNYSDHFPNSVIEDEKPHLTSRFAIVDRLIEASSRQMKGYDTTSVAMAWFLYLIAKHPENQQLIVDELDSVFSGNRERPCTIQDVPELKYMECCIKETLRLYPSVPSLMRKLIQDVELDGYTIPAGVTIIPIFYAIHHNPCIYPDPEAFKPERFFPENSNGRHPFAFIPFSAGPRNCLGQKYAMMELKVVFANLLRRVQFSVSDPAMSDAAEIGMTLKPKYGVRLIVSKRLNKV
ncbi:hypothetical protein GHT06_010731 [Daphnia sinensis]|uniref:Uncharacterized protein n=1 Tax=Daphnia sinensis TaxID=1820382 RepID=A0AAD5LJ64_9CRUS|nr:hypothetical protein GHT06_010731 [Daphnia sinensis]